MAFNGLAEAFTGEEIVKIANSEFEELIRDSEKAAVIKRLLSKNSYLSHSDLCAVLDIKNESGAKENECE